MSGRGGRDGARSWGVKAIGGRRGEAERARASVKVCLAPVRTAPSRGDACSQNSGSCWGWGWGWGRGRAENLLWAHPGALGSSVFLSLAGCHSDLCLEWLGRGLGNPFCRVCVCVCVCMWAGMRKVPSWLRHGRCAEDRQGMAIIIVIIRIVIPFMAIIQNEAGPAKLPSHIHFPSSF